MYEHVCIMWWGVWLCICIKVLCMDTLYDKVGCMISVGNSNVVGVWMSVLKLSAWSCVYNTVMCMDG